MGFWVDAHLLPMSYVSYCTWKVWRGWCRLLGAPRVAGSTQPALGLCTEDCCCCRQGASVVSDSVQPQRWQPTRLPRPWDSPGENTGVGCHFLLRCMKVKSFSRVRLLATPWTAAYQAPPSMGFSRQEYWSGVPLPSPGASEG